MLYCLLLPSVGQLQMFQCVKDGCPIDPGQVVAQNEQRGEGCVGHGNVTPIIWDTLVTRLKCGNYCYIIDLFLLDN